MKNLKKIVFVYHTSIVGGGSYCLLNILKEIDRNNFLPIVVLREYGPLVAEIERLGIEVYFVHKLHVVPYNESVFKPRNIINAVSIIRSLYDFRGLLKRISPDIVYINSMMLYPYLRVSKQLGIKSIIHIREHWPKNEHTKQRGFAINHIMRYADRIVAINSFSLSMFSEAKQPKTIVYDWIDLSERSKPVSFESIFGESMEGKKVYLFMGGLQDIKGPLEVLDVFINTVKDPKARLLYMGFTPSNFDKGIKGSLKNMLAKLGYETYSKRIQGLIDSDKRIRCIPGTYDVKKIFEQSYCILSYFKIPHANLALAESIISGAVNVAAKTPESVEYSHNGELAVLFDINDKELFKKSVLQLESSYDEMKGKIHRDSHFVSEMFDRKRNAANLMSFIDF